ncbi:MAG: hypothetical protein HRT88_07600 [Lentisphaeraceae bacterium]|nr:hypothetical protein [Lentisphaeraceae bacterium]
MKAIILLIALTLTATAVEVEFVAENPARIIKGELIAGDEKSVIVKAADGLKQVNLQDVHKNFKSDLLVAVLSLKTVLVETAPSLHEFASPLSHQRTLVIINHYHALYLANPCWQTHHDYVFAYERVILQFPVAHLQYNYFYMHHGYHVVIVKRSFLRPVGAIIRSVIRHEVRESRKDDRQDNRQERRGDRIDRRTPIKKSGNWRR